jgi:methionine-rich copper-binding protein CopC
VGMGSEQRTGQRPRAGHSRIWRLGVLFTVIGLSVAMSGPAVPALAHAVLVRSDPAACAKLPTPPKLISLFFSEPLEPKFSSAKVVDTNGNEFDERDSRVDAGDATHFTVGVSDLKPGFYSVLWNWISDGIARTAMPAWKGTLSNNQRWSIVNYLRTIQVIGKETPPAVPTTAAAQSPAWDAAAAWAAALKRCNRRATREKAPRTGFSRARVDGGGAAHLQSTRSRQCEEAGENPARSRAPL